MKSNWFWLLILVGVIVVSAVVTFIIGQTSSKYAQIYQNGTLTETVNIAAVTDPFTIEIESSNGTNVIAVEHGRIKMISADCPDQTCVRQGWISGGVFPIVCLPNRVVVTLEDDDKNPDVDAVVG